MLMPLLIIGRPVIGSPVGAVSVWVLFDGRMIVSLPRPLGYVRCYGNITSLCYIEGSFRQGAKYNLSL